MRPASILYQWTQTPVSGFIGRRFKVLKSTSFATKKVNAFQVNFSEFNNKLVAAFTTNGVENSVSFHCLTFFFLLLMLKNTFTTFPVSSQVFWCLEHTTNLTVKRRSWSIFRIMQMYLARAQLSKHMDLCCFDEVGGWKLEIYPQVWGNPWPHWCINYALICFYGPINACILRILWYEVVNFWYAN